MNTRFPVKITLLATFITVSTVALVMLMFYNYYQDAIANEERNSTLQSLSADILLYDEQLTSSALLAAYSGNSRWVRRYNFVESELIQSIDSAIALSSSEEVLDAEERTMELQRTQDKLTHQANYDDLTGLPNRRYILNHLEGVITEICENSQVVVMLIDLDYFKRVNDTLGHAAGDELLQRTAQRLQEAIGSDNIVARLGGDEFLVVSEVAVEGSNKAQRTRVANQILQQFETPFILGGREYNLPISPSIGIAVAPNDGSNVEEIMQNADTAMYAAKDQGRNNACFYLPGMNLQNKESVILESKLRSAISSKDQFQLYYQPQIDLTNNQVVGVEALLRWIQPEDGLIAPDQFIPLAEDTGLILEIGQWVLFEAARQSREWQDNHAFKLNMSINVASQQLTQKDFFDTIEQAFREHGIKSDCFGVEITESALIGSDTVSSQNINSLSEIGVKLSLDDFGTGYSALSYLKQYPFDYIKIDRSFVATILEGNSNAALVEGIINMSRNINLKVVGEGTETLEQCELLRQYGCDIAQGYYYSKPLPSHELVKFMQSWRKPEIQALLRKAS